MAEELKPCPFCGCSMRLESNRDWHRIVGDHALECAFTDSETMVVPATKSSVILLSPTGTPEPSPRTMWWCRVPCSNASCRRFTTEPNTTT